MKVVLLRDVAKIGKKYDIKNVSDGYALNFLIPNGMAKIATADVVREMEATRQKHNAKEKADRDALIGELKSLKDSRVDISATANEDGGLFAGIDKKDIILAIKDQKALDIDEDCIVLDKPIKSLGEHDVEIKCGDESTIIKINVIPNKE